MNHHNDTKARNVNVELQRYVSDAFECQYSAQIGGVGVVAFIERNTPDLPAATFEVEKRRTAELYLTDELAGQIEPLLAETAMRVWLAAGCPEPYAWWEAE